MPIARKPGRSIWEGQAAVRKLTSTRREFPGNFPSDQEPSITRVMRLGRPAMGTRFEVATTSRGREDVRMAHNALNEVGRLENILSIFRDDSNLSRMNRAVPGEWFKPDPDLWTILFKSLEYCRLTGGALDIAIGALWKTWGFHLKRGRVPSGSEIEDALANSGFHNLEIREDTREVRFLKPGMEVNLGGTGKGYALDRAAWMMENKVAGSFLLNAGFSTFYASGNISGSEEGWKISIRGPDGENSGDCAVVRLKDQALATSGPGSQYFDEGGIRYCHILDPRTGRPASRWLSSTAVARSALEADALSTAFFVMEMREIEEYCEKVPGVGALLITGHGSGADAECHLFGLAEEIIEVVR